MKTFYVIRNNKYNNYYNSYVMKGYYHFVKDIDDAKLFNSIKEAQVMLNNFKNQEHYEILVYKYGK